MTEPDKVDKPTYDAVRPYLEKAFNQMLAAGHSIRDFVDFATEKFGDTIIPYLKRFLAEVQAGTIKLSHVSEPVRTAIFGLHPSPQQREHMVREAAYFRAQQRNFCGGNPDDDWCAAEAEVDQRIAAEVGLVGYGRQALSSIRTVVEKEFSQVSDSVKRWLDSRKAGGTGAS